METSKTLRRPAHWQDFENLCKKLWGEIWNCPEIQKNGRLGQDQSGVDIFGIPDSEEEYFGIQCKGKTEYNDKHSQFTEKEIIEEIEKAKSFEPKLKKLYFATTALNDSKIQTLIRIKNVENKKLGLFEVHLFCWESIVDLIDENKQTKDYYVNSQNYKTNKKAKITFDNNQNELEAKVFFQKKITNYRKKNVPASMQDTIMNSSNSIFKLMQSLNQSHYASKINNSFFVFYFRIHNIGLDPIEDFKVLLKFDGEYQELDTVTKGSPYFISNVNSKYDTFIDQDKKTGTINPLKKILVGEDSIGFDDIKIKPFPVETIINIGWKIISRDYKNQGNLKLKLIPEIKIIDETFIVEDISEERIIEGPIEDHIS